MPGGAPLKLITEHAFEPSGFSRECDECGRRLEYHARVIVPPSSGRLSDYLDEAAWGTRLLPPVRVRSVTPDWHPSAPAGGWAAWCRCCRWTLTQAVPADPTFILERATEHGRLHLL